ncbi:Tyrosine-protein phosphatase 1 [Pichia kudriavzevii]|uniref:protein-tyrosine-phosphatase n=1 Tax=Pichia kudriavzevii TaxID=4909 RepID=A0A1V2LRC3_PICKU|nr:Tyrosine-protein phosphatase 1 [Pichia kudriavzevii]
MDPSLNGDPLSSQSQLYFSYRTNNDKRNSTTRPSGHDHHLKIRNTNYSAKIFLNQTVPIPTPVSESANMDEGYFSTSHTKNHRRGTENSPFNSNATLVNELSLPSRVSSVSSETTLNSCHLNDNDTVDSKTLVPMKINEEDALEDPQEHVQENQQDNGRVPGDEAEEEVGEEVGEEKEEVEEGIVGDEHDYQHQYRRGRPSSLNLINSNFNKLSLDSDNDLLSRRESTPQCSSSASSSSSINRGMFNRSKLHGLGHRTTKSDSFSLKLPLKNKPLLPNSSSNTTTSNLSSDSLPLRTPTRAKKNSLKLPDKVHLLKLEDAQLLILNKLNSVGDDNLSNLLIIDVRPFHDFCQAHMSHSINICLPSTLLKRPTFTLQKCIQTLTSKEKNVFSRYALRNPNDLPDVLFYDNFNASRDSISSQVFFLVSKFLQDSNWNSSFYILEGGFNKFNEKYNYDKENSNNHNDKLNLPDNPNNSSTSMISRESAVDDRLTLPSENDNSSTSFSSSTFSSNSNYLSPHSLISPAIANVSKNSNAATSNKSSPTALSRFILPDSVNKPVFKTRNYDEVLTSNTDLSIHLTSVLTPNEFSKLPVWLTNVFGNDLGSSILTDKFNHLQLEERNRLNQAFNRSIDENNSNPSYNGPLISSGIELGRKNRYKDIFLYEHARVKLNNDSNDILLNYINASYIKYPSSKLNYIATQGPLKETIGDFWKVVYDNDTPIIFSLTPQHENLVEKCAPFWNSGIFYSNGTKMTVGLVEEIQDLNITCGNKASCSARLISIRSDDMPVKHILQVHMMSWPDFGIVISEEDILSLIGLKKYVLHETDLSSKPVVVHCSAGCGRTGAFCVIDTCIDLLSHSGDLSSPSSSKDLVYEITSVFRSQRIFMVQTLRQYILIYDTIIKFFKMRRNPEKFIIGDKLTVDGLIDWEAKDPGILGNFISLKLKEKELNH